MNVVLDTNVLVSALWSAESKPHTILEAVINRTLTPCHDYRIIEEYCNVLRRPKFSFNEWEINWLLDAIIRNGISVIPDALVDISFTDESDRKFYETAKFCSALLITGNIKHFPCDSCVMTVSEFTEKYL